MGGFGGFGGFSWIWMALNMLVPLVFVVGLVVLVVWAIRRGGAPESGVQSPRSQSPKDIAQARYARGDINREEYQQILSDLGN